MIGLVFSGITLAAVFIASFVKNMRHAILALWVAGLGVGAVYLTLGSELLAIVQWVISTLVTIAFIFFAVMFGEYNDAQERPTGEKPHRSRNGLLMTLLSLILGTCFAVLIWRGTKDLNSKFPLEGGVPNDLGAIGRILTQENFLSLEVLALTLFLVLVGGGVVARLDGGDES